MEIILGEMIILFMCFLQKQTLFTLLENILTQGYQVLLTGAPFRHQFLLSTHFTRNPSVRQPQTAKRSKVVKKPTTFHPSSTTTQDKESNKRGENSPFNQHSIFFKFILESPRDGLYKKPLPKYTIALAPMSGEEKLKDPSTKVRPPADHHQHPTGPCMANLWTGPATFVPLLRKGHSPVTWNPNFPE